MSNLTNEKNIKDDIVHAIRQKLIKNYKIKDDANLMTNIISSYPEGNNHVIDIRVLLLPDAIDVIEGKNEQRATQESQENQEPVNTNPAHSVQSKRK